MLERQTFYKMCGAGNDFILVDNRDGLLPHPLDPTIVRNLCSRRLSIGADGVITLEKTREADVKLIFYNSDGNPTDFCGNGTRCAARLAYLLGAAPSEMLLQVGTAFLRGEVHESFVRVQTLGPREEYWDYPLDLGGQPLAGSYLVVGVPHYVLEVQGVWQLDLAQWGPPVRNHPRFEGTGVNANFVAVRGEREIDIRTWERGIEGETLSCGSGCVASAIAMAARGRVRPPVTCHTASGIPLVVDFVEENGIWKKPTLSGDARLVFRGFLGREASEGFVPR